jgi:hypothetical protein
MCFVTTLLAALDTPEKTLLMIPIGKPRMLLSNWLEPLLLDEEDDELVVRASAAVTL